MISEFLVKAFIKNNKDTLSDSSRNAYGSLAGIIGIISNIVLFGIKLGIGMIVNSIALIADAFNNLTDSASSIITILGFKLSTIPPDEEHPFGHGRIEYISALAVSVMVMFVGFQFVKSSFTRIFHPSAVRFDIIPFILLLISILIKLWLSRFNSYIGKTINSSALKAAAFDAFGDVIISSVVAFSLIISLWSKLPIDGYLGMAVSLFILYSGYTLVKETLNPILGESPDLNLVHNIKTGVLSYEHINGVHDLIIHNYGPGRCIATIHAEVPANIDILKIHEVIDLAERELSEKLKIDLVIHMDPINVDNKEISTTRKQLMHILKDFPIIKSMHDFRMIGEGEHKNLLFDIVVDTKNNFRREEEVNLKNTLTEKIKQSFPLYNCIITIDKDFSSH